MLNIYCCCPVNKGIKFISYIYGRSQLHQVPPKKNFNQSKDPFYFGKVIKAKCNVVLKQFIKHLIQDKMMKEIRNNFDDNFIS